MICSSVFFLTEGASEHEQSEFLREIEFMKNVGFHRNINTMAACCTREDTICLIVEYACHGDLLHLLQDKRKKVYTVSPSVIFTLTLNFMTTNDLSSQ